MPVQTRDQKYAISVYNKVSAMAKQDKKERNSYGSMAHQLPILIRTAGLAQALAFVEAKSTKQEGYKQLLEDLKDTVGSERTLAEYAREAQLSEYMLLTRLTLDALLWYKRFAQSVLGIDPGDETKNGAEIK